MVKFEPMLNTLSGEVALAWTAISQTFIFSTFPTVRESRDRDRVNSDLYSLGMEVAVTERAIHG